MEITVSRKHLFVNPAGSVKGLLTLHQLRVGREAALPVWSTDQLLNPG